MTNLNKEREEVIYELLLSLNNGNTGHSSARVELAINQYNDLIKNNIITEWCEHDWEHKFKYDINTTTYQYECTCSKCGETKISEYPF